MSFDDWKNDTDNKMLLINSIYKALKRKYSRNTIFEVSENNKIVVIKKTTIIIY